MCSINKYVLTKKLGTQKAESTFQEHRNIVCVIDFPKNFKPRGRKLFLIRIETLLNMNWKQTITLSQ